MKNQTTPTINASIRIPSTKIKDNRIMPAVVYGPKTKPISVAIEKGAFIKMYRVVGNTGVLTLDTGDDKIECIVHDFQINPVTREFTHVDFLVPDTKKKMHITVPFEFIGTSEAVIMGGIFATIHNEVEVMCLMKDIPSKIEVDISMIKKIGDSIHYKDIKLPANVEMSHSVPMEDAVCVVTSSTSEEPESTETNETTVIGSEKEKEK